MGLSSSSQNPPVKQEEKNLVDEFDFLNIKIDDPKPPAKQQDDDGNLINL